MFWDLILYSFPSMSRMHTYLVDPTEVGKPDGQRQKALGLLRTWRYEVSKESEENMTKPIVQSIEGWLSERSIITTFVSDITLDSHSCDVLSFDRYFLWGTSPHPWPYWIQSKTSFKAAFLNLCCYPHLKPKVYCRYMVLAHFSAFQRNCERVLAFQDPAPSRKVVLPATKNMFEELCVVK